MKNLNLISDLLYKNRFKYILGIFCLIAVDVLQLVMPRLIGRITDLLQSQSLTKPDIMRYSIILILIAVGIAVFRFFWRYFVFSSSKGIEMSLRNRFYSHLQKLSINYYNHQKTGDLMAHATNDMNNISSMLGHGVAILFDTALIPIVAIIMMIVTVGLKLTLASFAPLVLLACAMTLFPKLMHDRMNKMQQAFSQLTETARENFSGIRVIKAFVQELKEMKKFEVSNAHNRDMNLRLVRLFSMLFPTVMTISALAFAIALWYGGILVIYGEISLGDFVAFNGYLGMLIWPIAAMGWLASLVERGNVSLGRVSVIMNEKPEIVDSPDATNVTDISGKIEFKNLNFSYSGSDTQVLKDISITVENGKTLAIVGHTGSGKTTLINLLQRLYNVEDGKLFIDGMDINKLPLSALRSRIGYVPQDTFLFSTTIKQNIDFFRGQSEERIINAAKTSKVYDDVMGFPEQFNTLVGERGVTLSGGQKQRCAIARAIVEEPAILLLDDCLSAVDTHTEEEILKGLKEFMKQRTSVIVSHRISTVKDADEIIVLEYGAIVERGNHQSLLEAQGIYYDLHQKQLLEEQLQED